jgi:lipocalin
METKNQPDQTPETLPNMNTPEESPVTVSSTENIENAPQLSADEKVEIVEMLQDEAIAPVESVEVKQEEPPVKTVEKPVHQISTAEKKLIVKLLRGLPTAVEEYLDYTGEEVDYEELNKLELVELLEDVVQESDFDQVRAQVTKINSAYRKIVKEEHEKEHHDFIAEGGEEEAFVASEDVLDKRFKTAFEQYKHTKAKHSEEIENEKTLNLQRKLDLLEELKTLINSEETLKKTYDEFKNLQDAWKEIGMVPATELRNLWQNYHFLVEKFFDKVRINKELRDLDMKKNQEQKLELCEKAEELLAEKSIIKSFKLLQHYHDKWREIGPVPGDVKEELWDRFKGASDKINQRRKDHYKDLQGQQQANLEAKNALIEKLDELLAETPDSLKTWQTKTDQVNETVKIWKSIGRATKEQNDEVWKNFKSKLDTFFNARRAYLSELKDQQLNNYNLKLDLCVRAESYHESDDWKNATRDIIQLQKEWKTIGPVPRKHSDKVWKRFRAACDAFFDRKSAHFKNQHGFEEDNLTKKQEIIAAIKGFEVKAEKSMNLEALKNFQRTWMEIGHVPFNMKDKLQNEYREAIDALIDKMDLSRLEATAADFKSKVEMLKSGPEAGRKLSQERTALANKMKFLQDDILLWENNIGFFANSKQANKLKHEFELKIERAKKELAELKAKVKVLEQ